MQPANPASDNDAPTSVIISRRVMPLRKLRGALFQEFPLESFAEFRAILYFRKTSPVGSAHRWHPEQSVGGLTGRSLVKLRDERLMVSRRGPLHIGDFRDGSPEGTGVAMAVEAPAHAERRHLGNRDHLVDAAVAGDAANPRRHVHAVGEIGVVGQIVDANPAHWPGAREAVPNRREQRAVPLDRQMAVHARLRGRNIGDARNLDRGVAVAAVETKLSHVELVAVRDGLSGTIAHIRVPRGKEIPHARDREYRNDGASDGGDDRELIPPRGKDLGQRLGLHGAGGQLPRPRVRHATVTTHLRAPESLS